MARPSELFKKNSTHWKSSKRNTKHYMTRKYLFKANMKHFLWLIMAIQVAQPHAASSQCIDSLTVAESNLYLLKGAEAREQLALCREYRKIDSEVIAQQERITNKLLDEIKKRDERFHQLRKVTIALGVGLIIFVLL